MTAKKKGDDDAAKFHQQNIKVDNARKDKFVTAAPGREAS